MKNRTIPSRPVVKDGFIDRIIYAVSPSSYKKRLIDKLLIEQQRSYDAADHGARTAGMNGQWTSANTEVAMAASILRNRSRDMVRNNPWMIKGVKTLANNVIGSGIRPSSYAQGSALDVIQKKTLEFLGKKECDFHGRKNFYMIQKAVMKAVAESGAVLVLKRRDRTSPALFRLQVAEIDLLDTTKDGYQLVGGSYIDQGIQVDKEGRVEGYWIYDSHPGDNLRQFNFESRFVSKNDVIHVYNEERPGQINGVPVGHASMIAIKDMDDFRDAEMLKQKIAALMVAFVSDNGLSPGADVCAERVLPEMMEPGTVVELPMGSDVKFPNPPQNQQFEVYMEEGLRAAAAGMGISYESLSGNLKNVNFSSGRMGWLEMSREIQSWQDEIITQLCEPVWGWFIDGLKFNGLIPASTNGAADWTAPRREMLDPVKETNGLLAQVNGGLMSLSEGIRKMGFDPEDVLKELATDKALLKKYGLEPENLTVFFSKKIKDTSVPLKK